MDPNADQLNIDTPELVSIQMPLAGIGSRFIALLIDTLIWGAGLVLLGLLVWAFQPALQAFSNLSYQWTVALLTIAIFLLNWGYFTLFEAFANGRTPGKRVARIRVIQQSGRPIGIFESMARNFIRYVDQIPFFYAVGVIVVFATRQHQRLGDLAAGTLVVRDREQETPLWADTGMIPASRPASASWQTLTRTSPGAVPQSAIPEPHSAVVLSPVGIGRLTPSDLEVLEGFFARRLDLPLDTRQALAQRIAGAILAKSGLEMPAGISVETFLEAAARDLRDQARLR
ncbi:MAG TPA: RDD family protein [Terracidiphilus sp.]|nr:RDD family protein [Terracidiphilus sp.]